MYQGRTGPQEPSKGARSLNAWLFSIDWRWWSLTRWACFLVYSLARLLMLPFKLTLQLIGNAVVGVVLLLLFNLIGGLWGFHLPLNPVTAVVAGFLGIPGVLLLFALKYWVYG